MNVFLLFMVVIYWWKIYFIFIFFGYVRGKSNDEYKMIVEFRIVFDMW